jgi:hypothetical protein
MLDGSAYGAYSYSIGEKACGMGLAMPGVKNGN